MENTPRLSCLKTSSGSCPGSPAEAMPGVIIEPCLKRSQRARFQCLDLDAGPAPEWCEGVDLISLGSSKTPVNITESHSEGGACLLSSILQAQASVPQKYSLSPKACQGILRRAQARGKELPPMLKAALEARAAEQTDVIPPDSTVSEA